jgi:hypothetical protein
MKDLPFAPVKDFTPIMAAAEPVTALAVNAELRGSTAARELGRDADRR